MKSFSNADPDNYSDDFLVLDAEQSRRDFNKQPFGFSHGLSQYGCFAIEHLLDLARQLPKQDVSINFGDVDFGDWWKGARFPIEEAVGQIETAGSYVLLKRVNQHPEFRSILNRTISHLESALDIDIEQSATQIEAFIFMAAPNAVTPFHIDAESVFLMQIEGEKTMWVGDPNDRAMVTNREIEQFYRGDESAPKFKQRKVKRAHEFQLRPGLGVHLPTLAPHWVRNTNNVSIAMSVSFVLPQDLRRKQIYVANSYLRKINRRLAGDPGSHPVWDSVRSNLGYVAARSARVKGRLFRSISK